MFGEGSFLNILKKSGLRQYVSGILVTLIIVCGGMNYGWSSPYLPVLESGNYSFKITSEESSYLAIIPSIAELLGALVILSIDFIGRRNLIILSTIPFIVSWVLVGLASSTVPMFLGRFIAGISDGMTFNVVPVYLAEISSPKTRGLLTSLCPVAVVAGYLFIYVVGACLPLNLAAFASTAFPLVLLASSPYIPESPYFYFMKGKMKEAEKSLQALRGKDDVKEELNRISKAVKEQNQDQNKFFDLFTVKSNRKGLLIGLGLRGFQQLTGYTAIVFYCKTIFEESNGFISADAGSIIYSTLQLVLSILSSFIVDISGRRPLLIISLIGTTLAQLLNGIFLYLRNCTDIDVNPYDFIPLVALFSYIVIFSLGMQTIPFLIMGEIFPTNVKAFATFIMELYFALTVTVVSKFFHWSSNSFGMHVPFLGFAVFSLIGLIFVIFVVPETKGKTLEEIQDELGTKRNRLRRDSVELACGICET